MKTDKLIENELFSDEKEDIYNYEPDNKIIGNVENSRSEKKQEVIENFNVESSVNTQVIFLIFFGLFIIYMLDNSNKILK